MQLGRGQVRRAAWCAALAAGCLAAAAAPEPGAEDLPVGHIGATTFAGFTNAIRLANHSLEVILLPDVGRLAHLALGSHHNMLRLDEGALQARARGAPPAGAPNYGGDWLWPVAQERWPHVNEGREWPPPDFLADQPWTGTAWRTAENAQCGLLRRDFGEPLNIRVSRTFQLDAEKPLLTIRQRIERIGPSAIPVTVWSISQLPGADRVVAPAEADTSTRDYHVLAFDAPAADIVSRCESSVVFHVARGGEHKLGFPSPRGWIAAHQSRLLLIAQALPRGHAGTYPDRGSRTMVYAQPGLGYTEIETLSPEAMLAPGQALENTVQIQCVWAPATSNACDIAQAIRSAVGEISASSGASGTAP